MKLFIGCGSSDDIPNYYLDECSKLLNILLKDNDLIFGAYSKGIMGLCYNIAHTNNRNITGIALNRHKEDVQDLNCNETILVDTILERTNLLLKSSDAIVFLPGGIGTINEIFASIDLRRSNEIDKKIVFYNVNHYFDNIFEFLDRLYSDNFSPSNIKDLYFVSDNVDEIVDYLNR